jgi:HEPN domain-containing protein
LKASTLNWLKIAAKDLRLAKAAIDIDEPLGVISHMHDCIEKSLKGLAEELGIEPPRIHSLKKLAVETCKLSLESVENELLILLDRAYIDSRYPEEVERFEEEYDIENCQKIFIKVEATFKWLKSLIEKN